MEIPKRKRGHQSATAIEKYEDNVKSFCDEILQINSTLDFRVSSRGWCYILEDYGLLKSDFDKAQDLINECRKTGDLPLDICAKDKARVFNSVERLDTDDPAAEAAGWIDYVLNRAWKQYNGSSFWEDQEFYVQMVVEKIDLIGLFLPVCEKYNLPIANGKGWSDLWLRADMMRRFQQWERAGKKPVLLYCGDHDPAGLLIKNSMRKNISDLSKAVGWSPDNLIIDRFGLNYDFIEENNLSWIDNLITGSKKDLANPKHADHKKPYVQNYIKEYGARKCEANSLVVRTEQGRQLCRDAVNKYVPPDAPAQYEERMHPARLQVKDEIHSQLERRFAA
jgi:hypothetical protein